MDYVKKCEFCEYVSHDKSTLPCSECPINERFVSHFKPHKVYINLCEAGMINFVNTKEERHG